MCTRVSYDTSDLVAGARVDDEPVRSLERGQKDRATIGRDGHPVAATIVAAVPEQRWGGAQIGVACRRVRADGLDVLRALFCREPHGGNAANESEVVVHVIHEYPDAAPFDVVPDARLRDVQQVPVGDREHRCAPKSAWQCERREGGASAGEEVSAGDDVDHARSLVKTDGE